MKHHVRMALAPPRVPFLFIVAGARRRRTNHRHAQAASLRARKPRVAVGYVRDRTRALACALTHGALADAPARPGTRGLRGCFPLNGRRPPPPRASVCVRGWQRAAKAAGGWPPIPPPHARAYTSTREHTWATARVQPRPRRAHCLGRRLLVLFEVDSDVTRTDARAHTNSHRLTLARHAHAHTRTRTHAHARTPPRAQSWGRRRLWARIALFPGLLSTRARARARAELAARRVLRVLGGGAAPVRAGGDGHHGVHRGRPHRGRCKSNKQVTGNCNDKLDVLVMEYIEVACIETCQLQLQCQRRQQQFDNDNDSGDRNGLLGKAWAAVAGHTGAASLLQWCPCRSGGGV